ncbi:MAG: CBS domain-containing protein [candidate division Zixibacteria bacterium]|nr:CBS domain-containing protein [candidate division Zixibacteria bacterium]
MRLPKQIKLPVEAKWFLPWARHWWRPSGTTALIALAVLVGLATGLGAAGFTWLVENARELFFGYSRELLTQAVPFAWKYWIPIVPLIGGLLVGPIVYLYAREARGHGVPEVMVAVARMGGIIRPRVAAAKAIASAICIGSGGSAGREGPIVQIGSALGSVIGQRFKMSADLVKILVGCGAAAGISAVFNAPIAGVLFSLEVILGDFAIGTFAPVIISSVVASVVSHALLGNFPAFTVPSYTLVSAWEIPLYAILGVVAAIVARLFVVTLYKGEDIFESLKIPGWIKPGIGGLMLGILGFFFPQVFADGYDTISSVLHGNGIAWLLVVLVFAKILATTFTLGSGNSGGIFAPSLFIGTALGGAFGNGVHSLFPNVTAQPGAYALVGMGAVVAAATHAPMTALMIIFEMTRDYHIILPLMVACVIATMIAMRLAPDSIYTLKLLRRGIVLRQGRDINVLARHSVSEVMRTDIRTIPVTLNIPQILKEFETTGQSDFMVVDQDGHLVGQLGFQEVRNLLTKTGIDVLVITQDIMRPIRHALYADDKLTEAWDLFRPDEVGAVPVVDRADPRKLVGIVTRGTITRFYNRQLVESLTPPGPQIGPQPPTIG